MKGMGSLFCASFAPIGVSDYLTWTRYALFTDLVGLRPLLPKPSLAPPPPPCARRTLIFMVTSTQALRPCTSSSTTWVAGRRRWAGRPSSSNRPWHSPSHSQASLVAMET